MAAKSRPNIVLITTDQHRADCFSFARQDIKTPHIDRLAENGTRFDRCYCPAPLCQPARASLLTGMLPMSHGVRDNGIDVPDDMIDRGFPACASMLGYMTALLGKAHLSTQHTFKSTGRPECRNTMAQYYDDWCGPYMGFDYVEMFVDGPVKWPSWEPPLGLHYTKWLQTGGRGYDLDKLYYSGKYPESGAQQVHVPDLPLSFHTSSWLGDRATDFIADNAGEDDPFMLWVSFPDPHHPFDAPEPWNAMYRPEDVNLPKHRDLDLSRRPWWHKASMQGKPQTTEEFREIREQLSRQKPMSDKQLRDITASYFAMISLVDHQVGRITAAIERAGISEDTIVIFTSDHGEFLGDHGLLFKGPMMYDSLIRVGMIASGPGIPEGQVVDDVVSTVDLAPTLVDLCGGIPKDYDGETLGAYLGDASKVEIRDRKHAYVEWGLDASRCGIDLDLRTVVTGQYRYTDELLSGDGELYDLINDPFELNNLFSDPAFAEVIAQHQKLLEQRPDSVRSDWLEIVGMC
ncbi:MAG: sulfatase family protein [Alphaproteobacteria bacterium]